MVRLKRTDDRGGQPCRTPPPIGIASVAVACSYFASGIRVKGLDNGQSWWWQGSLLKCLKNEGVRNCAKSIFEIEQGHMDFLTSVFSVVNKGLNHIIVLNAPIILTEAFL